MKNYKSAQFMHDNSSDDDEQVVCPICDVPATGGVLGYVRCDFCGWEKDDEQ